MIGFAISKLNLLIFVTAMFVIITYFTFGISDLMLSQRASFLAETYSKEASAIINSTAAGTQNTFTVLPSIEYFGGQEFFYVMKITAVEGEKVGDKPVWHIIFSIASRKEQEKIIASKRVDTKAEPLICHQTDPSMPGITCPTQPGGSVVIDPQSKFQIDSFIILKETHLGDDYVYITNCSATGGMGAQTCGKGGAGGNLSELYTHTESTYWE